MEQRRQAEQNESADHEDDFPGGPAIQQLRGETAEHGNSGGGQSPTQVTTVELSTLRLPSVIIGGKPQPILNLPIPANVVYANYTCKQPGGAFRAADILSKLDAYTIAYDTAVTEGAYVYPLRLYGRKYQLRKKVDETKKAYQQAVTFHFTQCANYAKQL